MLAPVPLYCVAEEMTRIRLILIGSFVLGVLVLVALSSKQTGEGPHGGVVKEADNFKIEMKISFPFFYTYLLNSNSRPISNKKINCNVNLIFPDKSESHVLLRRFEEDGFFAELCDQPVVRYIISFNVNGQTISAQFYDANTIVKINKAKGNDSSKIQ